MIKTSGLLYMTEIQAEFSGPNYNLGTYYRGAGYVTNNNTGIPTSGPIYMSQFYGTKKVVPGSQTFSTVGAQGFIIPQHTSITITVNGAGGGGGGWYFGGSAGGTGALTRVSGSGIDVRGNGGVGGAFATNTASGADGANGTGTGGTTNTTGGGRNGGKGVVLSQAPYTGGDGGKGGRSVRTGTLTEGGSLTVTIGQGGAAGALGSLVAISSNPTAGQNGTVTISWT